MDFLKLERNIYDMIKEEQIKLGYRKETIQLYYPLSSVNSFLGTSLDASQIYPVLKQFCTLEEERLGKIAISNKGERFCFRFSPKASEYIYMNTPKDGFLYDFIHTISQHNITMEEVIAQFKKYSDIVHVEKTSHGEFDYLIYFEDGIPDEYRYCLSDMIEETVCRSLENRQQDALAKMESDKEQKIQGDSFEKDILFAQFYDEFED